MPAPVGSHHAPAIARNPGRTGGEEVAERGSRPSPPGQFDTGRETGVAG